MVSRTSVDGKIRARKTVAGFLRALFLRGAAVSLVAALAVLGFSLAREARPADAADCPGGTVLFVANFVAPAGQFPDLSQLDLPLPLDFTADINPGPPGSNVDLITINACIPVTPGQPGVPPARTIPFTTPTPGGPAFFVTPTNTPPPTATQPPPATATPIAGTTTAAVTPGTGIRPPSTGEAGLKAAEGRDRTVAAATFACIIIALGGLAIGAPSLRRARSAESGRRGH